MSQRFNATMAVLVLLLAGCGGDEVWPDRPITLVCPWSAGGGTDLVSRQTAVFLEQELGVPVNVINATGGQGVTGHARGLLARPDGYTLAMMTFELNVLHWRGLTDLTWQDSAPLMSVNEDPAAVFVRSDSEIQSMADVDAAVKAGKRLQASGTARMGAWHLALAGWLISAGHAPDAITWMPTAGSAPSLQELNSGGLDLVCCSLPEARTLLTSGDIRCVGVMSERRSPDPEFEQYQTVKEQGYDWTLTGWRGLGVPRDTPVEIQQKLEAALQRIVSGQTRVNNETFPEFMQRLGFDNTSRPADEFRQYLDRTDQEFGEILSRDEFRIPVGPVGPLAFPRLVGGLLALSLVALLVGALRKGIDRGNRAAPQVSAGQPGSPSPVTAAIPAAAADAAPVTPLVWLQFSLVLLSVGAFIGLADSVGFIVIAGAILLVLMSVLSPSPTWSGWTMVISVLAPVLIYQLFSGLLKVPLPIGILGW